MCCFDYRFSEHALGTCSQYTVMDSELGVVLWLQIVQRISGRKSADEAGEGHCDKVIVVSCHPDMKLLASGSLNSDTSVKIWEDTN